MPKAGFRSITVSDNTYQLATQISNQEDVSLTQVITNAVQKYFSKSIENEEKVKLVVKALDALEKKEAP